MEMRDAQPGWAGRDKAAGQISMGRAGKSGCEGQVPRLELLPWAHSRSGDGGNGVQSLSWLVYLCPASPLALSYRLDCSITVHLSGSVQGQGLEPSGTVEHVLSMLGESFKVLPNPNSVTV